MIDANLKRAFDDVLNQDIPDRFTDLLAELRAAETGDASAAQASKKKAEGGANGN